jgi:hypothetical protein
LAQPLAHPDLKVGTEWRFVYFRYENAKPLVSVALSMVVQLLELPKDKNEQLKRYARETSVLMKPIVGEWESRYGSLQPQAQAPRKNEEE